MQEYTNISFSTKGKHIGFEERKIIERLLLQGTGIRAIGRILSRSHSSILYEVARKPSYDCYRAEYAEKHAQRRFSKKGNISKFEKYPKLLEKVVECLKKDWSPEEIAKRIKRFQDMEPGLTSISHETIYQFIYTHELAKKEKLFLHLRRSRKHRRKQGTRISRNKTRIPERVSIHERPENMSNREQFGNFETDSVIFSKQSEILSVQVDRKIRLTRLTVCANKSAEETEKALKSLGYEFDLGPHHPASLKSITFDNGTENIRHTNIREEFHIPTFFCDTYSSWQKGTVENMNMLIRQYLPRNTDMSSLSTDDIYRIQENLNNRPRKCLNYLTPNEMLASLMDPNFTITNPFP